MKWVLQLGFHLFWLATLLPWNWLTILGKSLGRIAMLFAPKRVRITAINLQLCFPELDVLTRRHLVTQHFEALGLGFLDMGLAWWATETRLRSWWRIRGAEHVQAAYREGRGVIFVTAHFVALEMGARYLCSLVPLNPVYRQHRNSYLEQLVLKQRQPYIQAAIPRHDVRLLLRTLGHGGCVWFAPDQNFSNNGYVFSPFFGIAAATNTATSRFAQLTQALVVPFVVMRREDAPGYDIVIQSPLENFPSDNVQADTDRMNAIFEEWIRQAPAQYLWSHRRFKKRPAGELGFY